MSILAHMSMISPGMGIGYSAITTQILLEADDGDVVLTSSEISWFASCYSIFCPIGCLLGGYLSEKIGRRNTISFVNVMGTVSWLIIGFSSRTDAEIFFIELMIGRALIGVAIGTIIIPTTVYCSEICHPKVRLPMTPLFMVFGPLLASMLGYFIPVSYEVMRLWRVT